MNSTRNYKLLIRNLRLGKNEEIKIPTNNNIVKKEKIIQSIQVQFAEESYNSEQ